jgi:RNA polymerase sigma-70 factor (ECF subfamily)
MSSAKEISRLLKEWGSGNQAAFDSLFTLVYDELHLLASRYMRRESAGHTLQTTALVNEAYLKLATDPAATWENRLHFFAVAATVMRHILVDHARARNAAKRGAGADKVSLDKVAVISAARGEELLALDEALKDLAQFDPRQSQIVELRYFGGLTLEETAEFLRISTNTVSRDWKAAKAWLYQHING